MVNKLDEKGFTLVELMIASAIGLVVLATVFQVFTSQQDTYVVQTQLSVTQQNIRSAMYMMVQDIQMAGYYTNFVKNNYSADWDDLESDDESIRPVIYARDDLTVNDIKDGTDQITIIKASDEGRVLTAGEGATAGDPNSINLNNPGDIGLDNPQGGNKFGIFIKEDLTSAELFEVEDDSGSDKLFFRSGPDNNYVAGDLVYRVDVIIYRISDADPDHPKLVRKNLGTVSGFLTIAEDIDNLQIRYVMNDGSESDNPENVENSVRAVKISLLGRTSKIIKGYTDDNTYDIGDGYSPGDRFRRKLITSTTQTRNIGL